MTSCPFFYLFCKENGCQNATVNNAETVLKYTMLKLMSIFEMADLRHLGF